MHRVRDRLVQRRTALIYEIRGFLLERGITFAAHPIHLGKNLPTVIEDAEQNLGPRPRRLLDRLWQEWKQTEIDIKAITQEQEIERIGNEDYARFPASARWSPPPPWPPSAMELRFDAISRPGWAPCHGSTPPGASRSCWASASAATSIYVAC
jgi:hypothetical protein